MQGPIRRALLDPRAGLRYLAAMQPDRPDPARSTPARSAPDPRAERLKAALKANLGRRKAQARNRAAALSEHKPEQAQGDGAGDD